MRFLVYLHSQLNPTHMRAKKNLYGTTRNHYSPHQGPPG